MTTFFFIIGILLLLLGALVFSAHMTDGLNRLTPELTGEPYRPNFFMAVPFPMSFIFGVAAIIILVSVSS